MRGSAFLLVVAMAGCDVRGSNGDRGRGDDDDDSVGGLESSEYVDSSNNNGRYLVEIEVGSGVTAFQITGESAEFVSLEELFAPDGTRVLYWEDLWSSDYSLTDAVFGYGTVTAFDWPVREEDGPLAEGTWTAWWSLVDYYGYYVGNTDVDVSIDLKRDDDFGESTVGVQVVYADGVDSDPDVVAAVEEAVERWREIWASYGITLDENYVSSSLDPALLFAMGYTGDPEIEDIANQKDEGDLQIVIGEKIGNSNFTYGVASGIPGTVRATPATYVVLSWLVHAGQNALFDDDEIRLMGETMAHEVGHYTGLYHPVESNYGFWDSLDDTVECTRANDCEEELGTNLMFPYSICDANSCLATDQLTDGQVGIAQRYVGNL